MHLSFNFVYLLAETHKTYFALYLFGFRAKQNGMPASYFCKTLGKPKTI